MKIVVYGVSISLILINKVLVIYIVGLVDGVEVKVLDINNYDVFMFSEDLEKEIGQVEGVQGFLNDLVEVDVFVILFVEYNGYYLVVYKNLFDWVICIDCVVFKDKFVVYLGIFLGLIGVKLVFVVVEGFVLFFGGNVKVIVLVFLFYDKFDMEVGKVIDEVFISELKVVVVKLVG